MLFRMLRLMVHLGWPFRMISPIFGHFNPFLSSYHADPYPQYRALREDHPKYVSRVFRALVLSRHEDITRVLKDPRFSVDRTPLLDAPAIMNPFSGMRLDFREAVLSSLPMTDPPSHTRIRTLVNKAFTPRRVELLRPRI